MQVCNIIKTLFCLVIISALSALILFAEVPVEVPLEDLSEVSEEDLSEVLSEVPAEVPVEVPLEDLSEVPEEVPSEEPAEVLSEVPVEVPLEDFSEVPEEVPSEEPAEVLSEVPLEDPSEVPAEDTVEVPSEVSEENPAEVPAEDTLEDTVDVPDELPVEDYSEETVSFENGFLSINVKNMRSEDLIKEISEKCKIELVILGEVFTEVPVSISFKDVPVHKGIKRVLRRSEITRYLMHFATGDNETKIVRLDLIGDKSVKK